MLERTELVPEPILLVDQDPIARLGVRALLEADSRFTVVADTAIPEAVSAAGRHRPAIILVDPQLGSGFATTLVTELSEAAPQAQICVYTQFFEPAVYLDVILDGATSYLLKPTTVPDLLLSTLHILKYGAPVIAPEIRQAFRGHFAQGLIIRMREIPEIRLSPREREVLRLAVMGATDEEIADQLVIAVSTVQNHIASILTKLDARTRLHCGVIVGREALAG
jgi:DNA-binding NarL/FixJ family response regulator